MSALNPAPKRNLNKPIPDDFAVAALRLGMHTLRLHYGVHSNMAARWISIMPAAWQAVRKQNMIANQQASKPKIAATIKAKGIRRGIIQARPLRFTNPKAAQVGSSRLLLAVNALLQRREQGLAA